MEMIEEKKKSLRILIYPVAFVMLLWLVKIFEISFGDKFRFFWDITRENFPV